MTRTNTTDAESTATDAETDEAGSTLRRGVTNASL